MAADGGSGGTTISIAVYRSSFPIVKWDLNDDDYGLTKAEWAWEGRTGELPESASPGAEVEWTAPSGYAEPTRAGFEFAGWSTDESASAGGFIDGSSPKLTMPEGAPESKSYTLYALWTPLEYSVVFDLAKNPEDGNGPGSDASYALNWESDSGVSRTVTDLGGGRFLVEGFTMDERTYDAATRTVGLPEPSRTGYRFLGWAEPDGQRLAIDNAAKDGYALNPVRLTQIDGTPVLTARWASAFGVTAPLSVTFGDYDKTGAPGNPWLGDANASAGDDTTQSEADDTTKDERSGYEALGQAYFENTSWHEAVKVVGLSSERDPSANQVLTTYDSKQASEAAVLGDGTAANPGERLLSLYPSASAPADKSTGVHFRLSDSLDEDALGSTFTMGAQGSGSERLPITYGLNLSTDPADGSANHGLVLPTDDYSRKQIATISYTFAVATAADHGAYQVLPAGDKGSLYIDVSSAFLTAHGLADTVMPGTYGLEAIKAAANDLAAQVDSAPSPASPNDAAGIAAQAGQSRYYGLYKALLDAGASFKVNVNGKLHDAMLLGICQDSRLDGGRAGLSFGLKDIYAFENKLSNVGGGPTAGFASYMNATADSAQGWNGAAARTHLQTFFRTLPADLRSEETGIVSVRKFQQLPHAASSYAPSLADLQMTEGDSVFLPSLYEVAGSTFPQYNEAEGLVDASRGYVPFRYQTFNVDADRMIKTFNGEAKNWWTRSAYRANATLFCHIFHVGSPGGNTASQQYGLVPAFCL